MKFYKFMSDPVLYNTKISELPKKLRRIVAMRQSVNKVYIVDSYVDVFNNLACAKFGDGFPRHSNVLCIECKNVTYTHQIKDIYCK